MRKYFQFDMVLAGTVLFLLIFGLVMITSIGVPKSISLSAPGVDFPNCSDAAVDCYLLFKKHLFRLAIAAGVFLLVLRVPTRFWRKVSFPIYILTVILLFLVLAFGQSFGTIATNWITVFNTSLQPSEFAKLAIIIFLAHWLSKKKSSVRSFADGFIPFCIVVGVVLLPIMLQNDFGNTMVIGLIALSMYFFAGANVKHIGVGLLLALLFSIIVIAAVPHVRERFSGFLRVNEECLEDYCWQSQQANIAVGSGGFWGKGLTQGVQKSYWLPQASDDFIFAASAEELGFLRIVLVVLAYFVIALRGYRITDRAGDNFDSYLALGITMWISSQAFINIGVNTALLPVTGITLPFVSYGGSSLLSSLIGIAILLNISANTSHYASSPNRRWNGRSRRAQPGRYRRA